MHRLLTVGMLVALLWPWPAPSDAQAQGPSPREVPFELWEEYPLQEPRSTPRKETTERRGDRHRPAPRATDRVTSDGSNATTAFLIVGLLLLAASAVLVFARASGRGVIERFRDRKRALRGGTPGASPAARLGQRSSGQSAVSDASALRQRIAEMRAGGMTLQAIADTLNAEGVPTLRGGALWRPSSVQAATGYKRPSRARRLA
jgi:hypothetical protein